MAPLSVPKVLTATAAEIATAPAGPTSRFAASAATSSACFICSIGKRCRYTRFALRYSTTTAPVPSSSASGRFRSGLRTSPPTNARSAQPSYAHRIATIATRNGDSPTAARCENMPPAAPVSPPSAKPSAMSRASAATLKTVLRFCSSAPRWIPK